MTALVTTVLISLFATMIAALLLERAAEISSFIIRIAMRGLPADVRVKKEEQWLADSEAMKGAAWTLLAAVGCAGIVFGELGKRSCLQASERFGTMWCRSGEGEKPEGFTSHENAHRLSAIRELLAQLPRFLTARRAIQSDLTPRESEVLHFIGDGKTNREVAQILSLNEDYVRDCFHSGCKKLGLLE